MTGTADNLTIGQPVVMKKIFLVKSQSYPKPNQVVLCPYFENVPSRSLFVIANVTVKIRRAIYS